MAQSLSKILIHVIFSTKERHPFLVPKIRPELHAYAATVLKSCQSPALAINSVENHVHVLCSLSKNWSCADLVGKLKTDTSKWLKTKGGILAKFRWQNGYGSFSVSQSQIVAVKRYLGNQEEHHRKVTFEDECRAFLKRHDMEYDERYVWD